MDLLLGLLFLMGLALGWGLGRHFAMQKAKAQMKVLVRKAQNSEWWRRESVTVTAQLSEKVQLLESKYRKEREKVKALESDLRWEKVQRMHPKKKLDHKK